LEVEAAEVAGYVNDFADEEEAGDEGGFHGFAGEFAGVDAAGGDFGFFVAFGGGGRDRPGMQKFFESIEGRIGVTRGCVEFEPAFGEAIGKKLLEGLARRGWIAVRRIAQCFNGVVATGGEIEANRLAFLPIGGDLENGGSTEAAMGEEHFFAEPSFAGAGDDFGGDSGELGIALIIGSMEDERDERGTRGNNFVTELAGEVVAERGGAHFGDGETASGDDKSRRAEFVARRAQNKFAEALDFRDARVQKNLDLSGATFGFEKIGDFRRGVIAEELAERFFVIGDAALFDEGDEILWRVARERGFCEMGIGGEEIFGSGVEIGKVAATSTGDEDFFADAIGEFNDGDAAATLSSLEGAEKSGGTGTEDEDVKGTGQKYLSRIRLAAVSLG
jgi:hypothetical protein